MERLSRSGRVRLVVLSALVAAGFVAAAGSVSARNQPKCVVLNTRANDSYSTLQAANDAATTLAGDTLVVKGTCIGDTTISKNLTITGQSNRGTATLNGNNTLTYLGSVVTINADVTAVINGLTITGGTGSILIPDAAPQSEGGGIANNGSLTLNNVTVTANTATCCGGGIYNPGTITLNSSTVSNNTGIGGAGGFLNPGTITLNHSTVTGNTGLDGGGIGSGGTITLNSSTISKNHATGTLPHDKDGGGIINQGGTVTLNGNSTVSHNTADTFGGGIYTSNGYPYNSGLGTVTLNGNSTISHNTATQGGGIYNANSDSTLNNCVAGGNVTHNTPDNIYP